MISVCDDCEYTVIIADLIITLSDLEKKEPHLFTLKIWSSGRELPFEFENHCDFNFLQEGIRIEDGRAVMYIYYDTIEYVRVDKK